MDEVLSHDFGNIVGDFGHNDSDIDQEEEENREREIQGLLADQFDEISSIGEDDEGDSDDQESVSLPKRHDGKTSKQSLSKSTPRRKRSCNNFGAIPEESLNGSFDAPEDARREGEESGDGLNVRYLLDQNNHVSVERSRLKHHLSVVSGDYERNRLKHHLSVVSGDYEGLQFKYQQMEEEVEEKDRQLVQLNGKVAALEMQVEAEMEAKKEYARKFSLAESTIQSLQNQMADLSKSDCLVRLQNNHDTVVKRMKTQHENEVFELRDKIENLVIDSEERQSRIEELERELKQVNLQMYELKRKSSSDLSKSMTSKSSPTGCKNSALYESLQSVKKELELAMERNEEFRNQNDSLKKSLNEYKNQNCDLGSILREKDQIINDLRVESSKVKSMNQTILREKDQIINDLRVESSKMKSMNQEMSDKLKQSLQKHSELCQKVKVREDLVGSKSRQVEQLESVAESRKKEIEQLESVVESRKKEIEELRTRKKQLMVRSKEKCRERGELFSQSEVAQMVKEATEDWRRSTEERYQQEYLKQVKKLEGSYERSKGEIVHDTEERMMRELNECVDLLCSSWIRRLAATGSKPKNEEVDRVLSPVRELWLAIEDSFEQHTKRLIAKREEAEEAKRQLEQVYEQTLNDPHEESLKAQLEEVKKELREQEGKLNRYKGMCKELQTERRREVDKLKAEFGELLKVKKKHFEEREHKLKDQLMSQWNEKCNHIDQAFTQALKQVKNQADDILEQSQRKSRDLLMLTVKKFHENVIENINAPSSITIDPSLENRENIPENVCTF